MPAWGRHGPAATPDHPRVPSVRAPRGALRFSGRRVVAFDLLSVAHSGGPYGRFHASARRVQGRLAEIRSGLRLLPDLYEVYNPMPYDGARDMEVELAIALREAGYGVWQA